MDDLAWTPGLPAWSPLGQVLFPPQPTEQQEPLEESVPLAPTRSESPAGEPATAKQKVFLSYMGVAFSSKTTKEHAAILMNEVMEDPKMDARIAQWNQEKVRLHPDIFAAELQNKREDRASRFFDACQSEGAECLTGVTKAHCQVLVGYLDVNYPNWDAHGADAARSSFFAAVAEKFPQLVRKEWRDKLKYPDGPRIGEGLAQALPAPQKYTPPSAAGALLRGAVVGLVLLLALYVAVQIFSSDPAESEPAPASGNPPAIAPAEPSAPVAQPATDIVKPPAAAAEAAPAATTAEMPAPSAEAPAMETVPATPAAPKTHVIIAKPIDVKLRFGTAKIQAGTQFKIVSQDATSVTVVYAAETVTIPIEATDLATPLPVE